MDANDYFKRKSELERDKALQNDSMSFKRRHGQGSDASSQYDDIRMSNIERDMSDLDKKAAEEDIWK